MSLRTIFETLVKKETQESIIDEKHREMQARNNHKALSMAYENSDLRKFTDFMDKVSEMGQHSLFEKSSNDECP